MRARVTVMVGGLSLLIGMVVGSTLSPLPFTPAAQADAVNASGARQLNDELDNGQNPLVEGGRLLARVVQATSPSVVHIQSERRTRTGTLVEETGSGVLVSSSKSPGTYVATNRHVIHGYNFEEISIHLHDGRVIYPARIWTDEGTDVAILKVVAEDLRPARWGDSDAVEIGHLVLAMGSPFGLSQSVTCGIISAKGRRSLHLGSRGAVLNQEFLQTDAAINPGNSGGPLINLDGRVVGINTAIASNSGGNEGIGFSIPSNLVRRVADQLLEHGKVQRAYLGVKLDSTFDLNTARRLKLNRVRGARIVEIYPNTPASRANLKFDDVVLALDGVAVEDHDHLINMVSLKPVGSEVELTVMRSGRKIDIQVLLADRAELGSSS